MTTNSPNPVDGDVQAHQMPELTQEQREHLLCFINDAFKSLSGVEPESTEKYDEKLTELTKQVFDIALAALTVEPVYQFIANNPDKDGYIEWADCNPDYFSNEPSDRRRILYTKPTDNHFRRIELPVKRKPWTCADCDVVLDYQETVKALIRQGYEVKS